MKLDADDSIGSKRAPRRQLDGRTVGQRQPRARRAARRRRRSRRRRRAAAGPRRGAGTPPRATPAATATATRRDDHGQRSAPAAPREARVDVLPHPRHRGLVGRIAQAVLRAGTSSRLTRAPSDSRLRAPPTCAAHGRLGGGDSPLDRRQRTAARRRDLGQLQPFDQAEHPGDAHVRADRRTARDRPAPARRADPALVPGAASAASVASSAPRSRPSTRIRRRAPQPPAHQADRDLRQPAAQRRRLAQRGQLLERRHERVLHDLFALAAVAEQARRDRQQVSGVAAVQHLAPPAIAFDRARHQLRVAGGVRVLKEDGVAHQNAHSRG